MPEDSPSPAEPRSNLSPAEFALEAGLGIATVRRYVKAGKLPKVQPGGERCRVMIPRSALTSATRSSAANLDPQRVIATDAVAETPINRKRRGPTPRWTNPDFNSR